MSLRASLAAISIATMALLCAPASVAQLANNQAPIKSATEYELERMDDIDAVYQRWIDFQNNKDLLKQSYALKRLLTLRPYSTVFRWELARVYGQLDDKTAAYDSLILLQQEGMAFDPTSDEAFKPVSDTPAFKHIAKGLEANAKAFGEGKVIKTLAIDDALIESIAFDPASKRYFLGSGKTGAIYSVLPSGESKRFIVPDAVNALAGVHALAVDQPRNALYVASTMLRSFDQFNEKLLGTGGIFQFELSTGKLVRIYPFPADGKVRIISSMVVAKSGELYAADVASVSVLQIRDKQLTEMFSTQTLSSIRGLALSPDHKKLYFSDYDLGLFYADLELNQVRALQLKGQNLGGIDGIYHWGGKYLLAIQNATLPSRIVRVELSADGGALTSVRPLEAGKPELVAPTFGVMNGDALVFISNSQRDLYDATGRIAADEKPWRRQLYQVSARFAMEAQKRAPVLAAPKTQGK
jgi:WD40 repeat protein